MIGTFNLYITPTLKNTTHGFLSNKDYKICLLAYKTLTNQQPTYTMVFHFRHILFKQGLLIHLFCPFHMSDHHLAKGHSLSSVHDSGIHFLLIPETRLLYTNIPFQAQNTPFQNCIRSLDSFSSPLSVYPDFDSCYSHFMPIVCHLVLNKIARTEFPYIRTDGVELALWFAQAFCYKPRTFSKRTENISVQESLRTNLWELLKSELWKGWKGWTPAGLTYVFAKGVSDQVRDPLIPRNSLQ